ncbi:hypothetical protein OHC33_009324 [Knufia fluminis]|uniref:Uncharacterized protein n=1 Tax=Knufia fluminis TaxID=191047 RepID=A0AAN8I1S0_9EURO|nr:hypothetical protein OHC33_009324 [Knufia fluminis]
MNFLSAIGLPWAQIKNAKSPSLQNGKLTIPSPQRLSEQLRYKTDSHCDTCHLCDGVLPDCKQQEIYREPEDMLEASCIFWMKCSLYGSVHAVCMAKYMIDNHYTDTCPLCHSDDHEHGDRTDFCRVQESYVNHKLYKQCAKMTEAELANFMMHSEYCECPGSEQPCDDAAQDAATPEAAEA